MSDQPLKDCVLIYDGECRMCVTAKRGLEQMAQSSAMGDIRMITYQSEEAKRLLGSSYRPGRPDAAFLVQPTGVITNGLEAFLPLLPGLRGGEALARLLKIPLATPLAYGLYRLIARYRYGLFGSVPLDQPPQAPG